MSRKMVEPKEEDAEPAAEKLEAGEAAVEEEVAAKPAKKRVEKKKRIGKKIHTYYKLGNENLTRLRPFCERCGQGYFMAEHNDRYTCGHCGFTRYKQTS